MGRVNLGTVVVDEVIYPIEHMWFDAEMLHVEASIPTPCAARPEDEYEISVYGRDGLCVLRSHSTFGHPAIGKRDIGHFHLPLKLWTDA